MDTIDFLALSPNLMTSFITSPPAPTGDFAFTQLLDAPNTPSLSMAFPQASHEYPPLMSPELAQLFGQSDFSRIPQFMAVPHEMNPNQLALSFPPELLAQVAPPITVPAQTQQCLVTTPPHLDLKCEHNEAQPWLSFMQGVLSHPLPFQSSLTTISPRETCVPSTQSHHTFQPLQDTKHEAPSAQSSALQKLHQRLLQRLRKSQADGPMQPEEKYEGIVESVEPQNVVASESGKKADSSFNKILELFSYYFNTQKTASPLACTAALYLGQVGFELQKRYEAYSRYIKSGVLEEMLVSVSRATSLRKLGIKSYEEFLRAEVAELRRIKDPERYLNRRMQVFQSYEPDELEGVYLSFDALYLLAKKPPNFRKEWLEEGKVRIVHICEIHDAWRSSPLNKTKRSRSPELDETSDGCTAPKSKVSKAEL